jgi:glycosyltransferase involved in cell wall biosynthesis
MPDPFERPPIANERLSIVLLARNVEVDVEDVVRAWMAHLEGLGREYEIILVDDGSDDRTGDIAEGLAAHHSRVSVFRHPTAKGTGAALRTGLGAARLPLLFYADASSSYQPADLGLLLEAIDKVDLVSGYRVWQTPRRQSRLSGLAVRWLARLLFGVRLRDPECSFKLIRRSAFARIPLQSDGAFAHTEILAKANFLGCLMAEVPISYREHSKKVCPALPRRHGEVWRVFSRPDFGPPILPVEAKELLS